MGIGQSQLLLSVALGQPRGFPHVSPFFPPPKKAKAVLHFWNLLKPLLGTWRGKERERHVPRVLYHKKHVGICVFFPAPKLIGWSLSRLNSHVLRPGINVTEASYGFGCRDHDSDGMVNSECNSTSAPGWCFGLQVSWHFWDLQLHKWGTACPRGPCWSLSARPWKDASEGFGDTGDTGHSWAT